MGGTERLTIEELARQAGVSVRTVRYYIAQGLLPGPGARGRAAAYDEEHLAKLRLIRRLADQHVPLAEQKARLADLSPSEVESLLRAEERRGAALERASQAPSPRAYISSLVRRAEFVAGAAAAGYGRARRQKEPSEPQQERKDSESWRRWELAPGLELHARADAAQLHAHLIERLLQTSRESSSRGSEQDAAFNSGGTTHDASIRSS